MVFFFPERKKKEGIEHSLPPPRQLGVQHRGITEIKKAPQHLLSLKQFLLSLSDWEQQ